MAIHSRLRRDDRSHARSRPLHCQAQGRRSDPTMGATLAEFASPLRKPGDLPARLTLLLCQAPLLHRRGQGSADRRRAQETLRRRNHHFDRRNPARGKSRQGQSADQQARPSLRPRRQQGRNNHVDLASDRRMVRTRRLRLSRYARHSASRGLWPRRGPAQLQLLRARRTEQPRGLLHLRRKPPRLSRDRRDRSPDAGSQTSVRTCSAHSCPQT